MTLRELYEAIGNSSIAPDAEVEVLPGPPIEIRVVAPRRPLPPSPSDAPGEGTRGRIASALGRGR